MRDRPKVLPAPKEKRLLSLSNNLNILRHHKRRTLPDSSSSPMNIRRRNTECLYQIVRRSSNQTIDFTVHSRDRKSVDVVDVRDIVPDTRIAFPCPFWVCYIGYTARAG